MRFIDLSWAAVFYYYRSVGDRKYCKIMSDHHFIDAIKENPLNVAEEDFEHKVVLDYINVTNYDLLYKSKLSFNILERLSQNKKIIEKLGKSSILDCNLSDTDFASDIMHIYKALLTVEGLWATGASKILHILNSDLFAPISPRIADHFKNYSENDGYISWLQFIQRNALEVIYDYKEIHNSGEPSDFLSERLYRDKHKCQKSIIKYIDEYYWMTVEDKLPIPPLWAPEFRSVNVHHTIG